MLGASVRRGLLAGVLAGLVAALFGLAVGEPVLDRAIALEAAAAPVEEDHGALFSRPQQKAGLVAGNLLIGVAVGAVAGLVGAWSAGRVGGDAWTRAAKLAAVSVAAVVLLPALGYPPDPPGVGDPATVGDRAAGYLLLVAIGIGLALAAWTALRQMADAHVDRPVRHLLVGVGAAAAAAGALAAVRASPAPAAAPADLVWTFRLVSLATQALLVGGAFIAWGLLSSRAERHAPARVVLAA